MKRLIKTFNTTLISTQVADRNQTDATTLNQLMESPAFKTILSCIEELARQQGIGEKEAAEQVIQTFRNLDAFWSNYVFLEGIAQIQGRNTPLS